ncbi:hypothetical protein BB050_03970 [Flavobacterium anhuiense]|uniref:Uncharacterized protein n=1 Tax=Flavobacterium anhuiense TaxID=459526 RepID=A0AAC9D579_9FLAO|nr:hypothetical protein BB050_03970 [Flavobacterium anhuiense]
MNLKKTSIVLYLFILYSSALVAQGGPPPPGLPDDTPDLPIDGQCTLLLAAGIILGLIVTVKRRKSH